MAGDNEAAFQVLSSGLRDFPRSFELRAEYAMVAARTERSALAIETWEGLIAAGGSVRDLQRHLARASLAGGFLEHARAPIQSLIARQDAGAEAFDLASRLAFEAGDLERAVTMAREAVQRDTKNPRIAYQLARVLVAADDDAARDRLVRTLVLDPGHVQARFSLGTMDLQADRTSSGDEHLRLRGLVQRLAGKDFKTATPEARIAQAKAVAKELPNWSKPVLEIARAQLALGKPKKAQTTLQRAADLAPHDFDLSELHYAAALARNQKQVAKRWLGIWKRERGLR